jgi:hypothetical protein
MAPRSALRSARAPHQACGYTPAAYRQPSAVPPWTDGGLRQVPSHGTRRGWKPPFDLGQCSGWLRSRDLTTTIDQLVVVAT